MLLHMLVVYLPLSLAFVGVLCVQSSMGFDALQDDPSLRSSGNDSIDTTKPTNKTKQQQQQIALPNQVTNLRIFLNFEIYVCQIL